MPYFVRDEAVWCQTKSHAVDGARHQRHVVAAYWLAVERAVDDPELKPARLTVDLLARTALEPIEVHTHVHDDRRRLRLVEAGSSSVVPRRTGERTVPAAWPTTRGLRVGTVSGDAAATHRGRRRTVAFHADLRWGAGLRIRSEWAKTSGPKYTWLHETRSLIDGEPVSPFIRAAMAADITASIANWAQTLCSSSMSTTSSR